jgi:peptide chain release factor 3
MAFRRNTTQKNFWIISHPDAGKQHLLRNSSFGGAIQEAGKRIIKLKKVLPVTLWKLNARGISVSTSVLAFNYKDKK